MNNFQTKLTFDDETIKDKNLCNRFSADDLAKIGEVVWDGYNLDKTSRFVWERRMSAAMDLAMQVQTSKTWPWPGCSNVVFPLVTIASLQFSARAYSSIVQGTNVVRYRVIGKDEGPAGDRAKRIGKHMSWQVLEQDESWEEQHDRLLINLAIIGTNFVKSYFDPGKGYPVDRLVLAKDLVIDYWAPSVADAARVTEVIPLYKNQIFTNCARGIFCDVTKEAWFQAPPPVVTSTDRAQTDKRRGQTNTQPDRASAHISLEQHCWFDFDQDGYEEPYIVTIEETSKKVLRIKARCEPEEVERDNNGSIVQITPIQFYTKYSFIPSPEGAIYDLGFGIFLGPINETVNSAINQMIDNGTLQNSIGGFLGRGAKIRGGVYTMAPWAWARVDSTGDDLRKNIVPFPERPASAILLQLTELLIEYANRVAGTVDATVGENPGQNTPASTFQGMTENGLQVYKTIFKRVWRCMKEEFGKRYRLNSKYLPSSQDFGAGNDFIRREDYTGNPEQVAPVADPNMTSAVMKIQIATAVKQAAMTTNGYDKDQVEIAWLESLGVEGIDRFFKGSDKVPPLPNFKLIVEQLKVQYKSEELQAKKQEWANKLMAEMRLNNAKIAKLEAEAIKLMKEASVKDIEVQIQAFDSMIQAHKDYGDMLNDRITALMGSGGEDGTKGENSNGGGVPGMGGASGQPSLSGPAGPMGGGAQGAMGGGSLPGGTA